MDTAELGHIPDYEDWGEIRKLPEYQLVLQGFVVHKLMEHMQPAEDAEEELWIELTGKDISELMNQAEEAKIFKEGELDELMKEEWRAYGRFTHQHGDGIKRVVDRFKPGEYPSNPTDEEIREALEDDGESDSKPN